MDAISDTGNGELDTLVADMQHGSEDAFTQLHDRFSPTVYGILKRMRLRTADIEDVSQQVFTVIHRNRAQLRSVSCFPGWVRQTAFRLGINHIKRSPHHALLGEAGYIGEKSSTLTSDEIAINRESAAGIWDIVQSMSELDRTTLIAFYWEGMSLIEMGERFGSPIGTIKRRLHTARLRFKEALLNAESIEENE